MISLRAYKHAAATNTHLLLLPLTCREHWQGVPLSPLTPVSPLSPFSPYRNESKNNNNNNKVVSWCWRSLLLQTRVRDCFTFLPCFPWTLMLIGVPGETQIFCQKKIKDNDKVPHALNFDLPIFIRNSRHENIFSLYSRRKSWPINTYLPGYR